jgi:type II secretory pathway component PulC
MKQQLWILNSSLLLIFILTLLLNLLLQQTPPSIKMRRTTVKEREMQTEIAIEGIENIYKYDLFGTFKKETFVPSTRELVTPIPQPKPISPKPIKELAKPKFLPPLKIDLKGIAFSSDENKSIGMIVDATKKEQIYHVGDTIKDAQIIKISKNRLTLLRANGQHETIFMKKDDNKKFPKKKVDFKGIIKKISDGNLEIDIKKFPKTIDSLGSLAEKLSLLTAYKQGKPIGVKISNLKPNSIGLSLGFKKSDIITKINKISVHETKGRIQAYDEIIKTKKGGLVSVEIERDERKMTINYKLTEIKELKGKEFAPGLKDGKKQEVLFKLNRLQERERKRRVFRKKHAVKQDVAVKKIRKRLLENIRSRARNSRIR